MLVTFESLSQKQSNSGALAHEACAAEHYWKFGYLCIQEVLALTKSSVRPPFHVSACEMANFLARSPEGIYYLAPVVQKVDSAIHRINLCSVDSAIGFHKLVHKVDIYPMDSAIQLLNNCGLLFNLVLDTHYGHSIDSYRKKDIRWPVPHDLSWAQAYNNNNNNNNSNQWRLTILLKNKSEKNLKSY